MRVTVVTVVVVTGVFVVSVYTRQVSVTVLPLASKLVRTSSTYVVSVVAVPVEVVTKSELLVDTLTTLGVVVLDNNSSEVEVDVVLAVDETGVTLTVSEVVLPSEYVSVRVTVVVTVVVTGVVTVVIYTRHTSVTVLPFASVEVRVSSV